MLDFTFYTSGTIILAIIYVICNILPSILVWFRDNDDQDLGMTLLASLMLLIPIIGTIAGGFLLSETTLRKPLYVLFLLISYIVVGMILYGLVVK